LKSRSYSRSVLAWVKSCVVAGAFRAAVLISWPVTTAWSRLEEPLLQQKRLMLLNRGL
jgi:hypothetical protein